MLQSASRGGAWSRGVSALGGSAPGGCLLPGEGGVCSRGVSAPRGVPGPGCCDMDQSDTIGKIELFLFFVLSSNNTNCKNDIQ